MSLSPARVTSITPLLILLRSSILAKHLRALNPFPAPVPNHRVSHLQFSRLQLLHSADTQIFDSKGEFKKGMLELDLEIQFQQIFATAVNRWFHFPIKISISCLDKEATASATAQNGVVRFLFLPSSNSEDASNAFLSALTSPPLQFRF